MRICLIAEGCYPYAVGGVSSWINSLITKMPQYEFVVQTIAVSPDLKGKFKYKLPPNLTEVQEFFLVDKDYAPRRAKKLKLAPREKDALESFVFGEDVKWADLYDMFYERQPSVNNLIMGEDFYDIMEKYCLKKFNRVVMTNFVWTHRSMMVPLCMLLKQKLPKADLYHSLSTGYSGVMGFMGKHMYKKPFVLAEHGIYTRERMEDIIRSNWTTGVYKDIWIEHFYKLSDCAYGYADSVTSLFEKARQLQIEIGCPAEKTVIVPNGVAVERYENLEKKPPDDRFINVGIIARVCPTKDIKTLINAFYFAKKKVNNIKLYIMGPTDDDEEYYKECLDLIETLNLDGVIFTGMINVTDYIGKMDISVLTSISEGQPLSMLEFMAAGIPCIATRVGCCEELISGVSLNEEPCGITVPILNISQISEAIVTLALDPGMRRRMGAVGKARAQKQYNDKIFITEYNKIYSKNLAEGYVPVEYDSSKIVRKIYV